MSDLPPGWEWTTLEELGTEARPGFASGKHNQDSTSGVLHLRPMNITRDGRLDLGSGKYVSDDSDRRVHAGDVLFNNTNSPSLVGKTALVSSVEPLAYSNHMTRLRFSKGILPQFIAHQLHYMWEIGYFRSVMSHHVNQASVASKTLLKTPIVLPPTAEQRRIIAALERHLSCLAAGEASVESAKSRLSRFRNQIIAKGCTGSLLGEVTSFASPPASIGLQDGPVPSIPASWKWVRLHEIADVVGGVTKDAKKQADPKFREVPYLRVANVQRGRLDLSNVSTIRVSANKIEQLALKEGDVLLNEGGDRDKLARGWIWQGQLPVCIHQNHVFRVRIRDKIIDPRLLAWHANSFGKNWAELNGKQSVNLASISLAKIRQLPVPVPPKSEQERIVQRIDSFIDVIDRLFDTIEKASVRAQRLRRSLLAEAFAGRLVSQDPSDEPASVLLERIRNERPLAPKPKRIRRKKTEQETLL